MKIHFKECLGRFVSEQNPNREYELFSMKRMKASEKKNTHVSMLFHLLFLFTLLLCSCHSEQEKEGTRSAFDAIELYRNELCTLRRTSRVDCKSIVSDIKRWQECANSTHDFLLEDSLALSCDSFFLSFDLITDSIKAEFLRMAERFDCSLYDLAYIKLNTSSFIPDSLLLREIDRCKEVFNQLDNSEPLKKATPETLIPTYEKFLKEVGEKGIATEADIVDFICTEAILFNTFLSLLTQTCNYDYSQITSMTEKICEDVYGLVGKKAVRKETVLTYMALRTNRRITNNAQVASDLLRGKNVDKQQEQLFLYMSLQPFFVLDSYSVYLLTPEQRESLLNIAKDVSETVKKGASSDFIGSDSIKKISRELLKEYLSTL